MPKNTKIPEATKASVKSAYKAMPRDNGGQVRKGAVQELAGQFRLSYRQIRKIIWGY